MTVLQFILSGLSGISLFLLVANLHLALRGRQPIYLAFAMSSLGVLIYIPCNLLLYRTQVPADYLTITQVQMYGTALFFIGLVWLATLHLHVSKSRLPFVYVALFGFFIIVRHINPMALYSTFDAMQPYIFIWGEQVWLPVSSSSLFGNLYLILILSVFPILTWISIRQHRLGYKEETRQMLVALLVLFVLTLHDAVVFSLGLSWLFLADSGLVLPLILLEMVTSEKLLNANLLAEQVKKLNHELERRVQERTLQLENANREMEAFSYSVSHDLRAPLRSINGFARILQDDFAEELSPQARGFLDRIRVSSLKMGSLIDELLAFSRLSGQDLYIQPVELDPLIRTVIDSLSAETEGRQIEWVLGPLTPARADRTLLQQVFANLIANAVKYTRPREQVRIEIGQENRPEGVTYFVRDNGVGFDMRYADKLFGVFQRLHRDDEFEGNGVGLAIVRRIVERHGGKIWAQAIVDQGATFYFQLRD